MGKLRNGILDGFTGKVGTVVGSFWKGIPTMRAYNAFPKVGDSPAQLEQRAKMSVIGKFLSPLTPFLRIGFAEKANKMSGHNAATSYNAKNAITGTYPDYDVDFTKVLVSQGNLPSALNPEVTATVAGEIGYTWEDNSGDANASPTDKAMLVVYNPAKKRAVNVIDGNTRAGGSQSITLPANFTGDEVQCFIAFKSATTQKVSNSEFVGGIIVL